MQLLHTAFTNDLVEWKKIEQVFLLLDLAYGADKLSKVLQGKWTRKALWYAERAWLILYCLSSAKDVITQLNAAYNSLNVRKSKTI